MMRTVTVKACAMVFLALVVACKTIPNSDSSLADSGKSTQKGEEIFACYTVSKMDSASTQPLATTLKEKSKSLCIARKPMGLTIKDSEGKELLQWLFSDIDVLRCPGCFRLRGANGELSATIARTAVPLVYNLSMDSRGLGGTLRAMLQQEIGSKPSSSEAPEKFKTIACGDQSRKVTGQMPVKDSGASLTLSGKSQNKDLSLPAKVLMKGDEWIFEATDSSGVSLRIINKSEKLYGVFKDSKSNDETDLGLCVADPKDEPLY